MKAAFWLGLILGFAGLLAAAHFVPWVTHTRLPSQTSVVANGGRGEQFLIRLPVDRIDAAGGSATGLRAPAVAMAKAALPDELAARPLLVEHFKVRDSAGNVIGLAARHWSVTDDRAETAWSLLIPSRGALLLTAPGEAAGTLDGALRRAGHAPGREWTGTLRVTLGDEQQGAVAAGSEEFDGLEGRYSEVWNVTGVGETGELRGTIELNTVTFRGS
jgi:hypothetical protein